MNKGIKESIITLSIATMAFTGGYIANKQKDTIDNENVSIHYYEVTDHDTYEVYVELKNGKVSEVGQDDKGTKFLISPDLIPTKAK